MDIGIQACAVLEKLEVSVHNKQYSRYFVKMFLYTAALFIIAVVAIFGIFYNSTQKSMQEQVTTLSMETLRQSTHAIDTFLTEVVNESLPLIYDNDINQYINGAKDGEVSRELRIIDKVNSVKLLKDSISNIYVYSAKKSALLDTRGKWYIKGFYDTEWIKYMENDPSKLYWLETRKVNNPYSKVYRKAFSLFKIFSKDGKIAGALLINIEEDKILKLINNADSNWEEYYFIVDEQGNVITSSNAIATGNRDRIKDITEGLEFMADKGSYRYADIENPMYVMYTTSNVTGWKIVKVVSINHLFSRINATVALLIKVSIFVLILGIMISLIISRKLSTPLINLVYTVKSLVKSEDSIYVKDEVNYLDTVFSSIIVRNKDLESVYNENLPILRDRAVKNLLMRPMEMNNLHTLKKLAFLKADIFSGFYRVMIAELEYSDDTTAARVGKELTEIEIRNSIEREFDECKLLFTEIDNDLIAILVTYDHMYDSVGGEDIEKCQNIINAIFDEFNVSITIGLGKVYDDIAKVRASCEEAKEALNYQIVTGEKKPIYYEDVCGHGEVHRINYPIKEEKLLINGLKTNDIETVEKSICSIFNYYKSGWVNAVDQVTNQIFQLFIVSLRTIMEKGIELDKIYGESFNPYSEFQKNDMLDEMKEWLLRFYNDVIEYNRRHQTYKHEQLMHSVIKYIETSYDKELSLETVAESVYLSPQYFNKLFKDYTGRPFGDYLVNYRLKKASEMLESTALQVNEIAEETGFNSPQYFTRAFRKVYGISPNEYRKRAASKRLMDEIC